MGSTIRVGANQLLESVVIDVVGVELEVELAPGVLLGDVSKSEFNAISQTTADVLVAQVNLGNLTSGISNHRASKTGFQINRFLGTNVPDNVVLGDFVPVRIGRKTV